MPTIRKETLRAFIYISLGGEDFEGPLYPAEELSYRSEEVRPPDRDPNDPLLRFTFYWTHEGVERVVTYNQYVYVGHSRGHLERQFVDDVAGTVERAYKTAKERFLRLQEVVQTAGYPV
jgi:hypothetical protein